MPNMRTFLLVAACLVLVAIVPAPAQDKAATAYDIDIDKGSLVSTSSNKGGKRGLYVSLTFKVRRRGEQQVATDVQKSEIEVREDGQPVDDLEITQPSTQNLTTVLAIDVSGSMQSGDKIGKARKAAQTFLARLDERGDSGLILFDHEVPEADSSRFQPPARDPSRFAEHKKLLNELIGKAQPLGGTAYLDAVSKAIEMLKEVKGRKAVLLLTDGVDMSSQMELRDVIKQAREAKVPVYTLGVGEPGKNEKVTTVLVLDHSGSMKAKASDQDKNSKMDALKTAAARFVDLMRPNAQTTLLPFSTSVGAPGRFVTKKSSDLKAGINRLYADGGTLLFDATLASVETLIASRVTGRKAVIVLTDGMDESPGSRHSETEVIERAREERIPLYMLGLGREKEINGKLMKRMAEETDGQYYHIDNEAALIRIFEKLAIDLHDEGIDEAALKELATKTGGKYYPARDASKLAAIYEELATDLQSSYTVTFRSRRQSHDGTARGVDIDVVRGGVAVSTGGHAAYKVQGVLVPPDMNPRTFLVLFLFLALLVGLLALPAGLARLNRNKSAS
jgi:VWFA-related protein